MSNQVFGSRGRGRAGAGRVPARAITVVGWALVVLAVSACGRPVPGPVAGATSVPAQTAGPTAGSPIVPTPTVASATAPPPAPTPTAAPITGASPAPSPTELAASPAAPPTVPPTVPTPTTPGASVAPTPPIAAPPSAGPAPPEAGAAAPSPTSLAAPAGRFLIGIRIDSPSTLQFWNQYAGPDDIAFAGAANAGLVQQSKAGIKALTYGHVEETQRNIKVAREHDIRIMIFDREQTQDCNILVSDEAAAYQQVKQAGLKLVFAPTGVMLRRCYQQYPQILENTDVIYYQTQSGQEKDANFVATVQATVRGIRQLRPGLPIWSQVSVNPPGARQDDPSMVVSQVKALEDGSPDSPDAVIVFYFSEGRQQGRVEAMETVIRTLKGAA